MAQLINSYDYTHVKKIHGICRAISHKFRQQILNYIHDAGQANVTDLYVHFRCDQSVMSQHLSILRAAGIVRTRREGKSILYSIHQENLKFYMKQFNTIVMPELSGV